VSNGPAWFDEIERATVHEIYHDTSFERACGILRQRRIHGVPGWHSSHEGFPHFMYGGWQQFNCLPVPNEIRLTFKTQRPARLRGRGNSLPEPGFLEVYESLSGDLWQCSLHPHGGDLIFVDSKPSAHDLAERLPPIWRARRWTAEASIISRLRREIIRAKGAVVRPVLA
jgi:hypothetical protein